MLGPQKEAMPKPLREIPKVRQIVGEPARRWFHSPDDELMVWLSPTGDPIGFQYCYCVGASEHALTWMRGRGYQHARVDSGEDFEDNRPSYRAYKASPILVSNGPFNLKALRARFSDVSVDMPSRLRRLVERALASYPSDPGEPSRRRKSPAARRRAQ
jgi:hypothetical protein